MNNKIKIFIVGQDKAYANFIENKVLVDNIEDSDIVLFTGGEDVHPSFYNENIGSRTYSNLNRDIYESQIFRKSLELNKFNLGICRGSQFLTVMSGGKLIQHVNNHGINGTHMLTLEDGDEIEITSTHHQMCYPYNLDRSKYEILGWSKNNLATVYLDGNDNQVNLPPNFVEPEIIFYYETNSLGIQGHPEYMSNKKTLDKLNEYIKKSSAFKTSPSLL